MHLSHTLPSFIHHHHPSSSFIPMYPPIYRQADDLRRHSLSDGQGGHYGTNLDRNRYGSDNNYLFTVTKYNLDRYVVFFLRAL
jgi:hypothetical protein